MEFLDSRIWRLGTISGRGFPGSRIWRQEVIKKQEGEHQASRRKSLGEGVTVGGSGCAIRGGGGTLKTSKQIEEEVNIKKQKKKTSSEGVHTSLVWRKGGKTKQNN